MWTMTVTFRLRFRTQPGQSLWLTGAHPLPAHPVPLRYVDEESWETAIPLTMLATAATACPRAGGSPADVAEAARSCCM